ncbi:MAG: diguanylate cyclase [Nitrospira sp.]|nr:diguanylate cyclase [bacterium]MBL7048159.1 diguanylate cyclase [Nitrospira sp.]
MFRNIGYKIIMMFASVLVTVMLILVYFFTVNQEKSILAQNERNIAKLTQSVTEGLQTIMIAGYADVAETFADRLHNVPDIIAFDLLRTDGEEAFKDNKTILDVNRRLGYEEFLPREKETVNRLLAADDSNLIKVLNQQKMISFYQTGQDGEQFLSFLAPIIKDENCYKCHGMKNPVRGVLLLVTSLAQAKADIEATRYQATQIALVALVSIVILTGLMITRSVIRPIKDLTEAMEEVSEGNLSYQVPILGRDELGRMAGSFNRMSHRLAESYTGLVSEQDKLTTIIQSTNEGIVVTDGKDEIVLINRAAEMLLGKDEIQIREDGFMQLFDDKGIIEKHFSSINNDSGKKELVYYKNRILSFSASQIISHEGKPIGSAALIRDVTEEKRLEAELVHLSTTDGLTGLYNRRYLNESISRELGRARRYDVQLAILMFDVDHFKNFNDVYGHETGDRVLIMIAAVMKKMVRDVDVACRYGGEEFFIILPGTDLEEATSIAERLRSRIELTLVDGLNVTISVGVANYPNINTRSIDEFIKAADKALYSAKAGGRNRVCIA